MNKNRIGAATDNRADRRGARDGARSVFGGLCRGVRVTALAVCVCLMLSALFTACSKPTSDAPSDSTDGSSREETTDTVTPPEPEGYTVPVKDSENGSVKTEYSYAPDGTSVTVTKYTDGVGTAYTMTFDEGGTPQKVIWDKVINGTRTAHWVSSLTCDGEGRIIGEDQYCDLKLMMSLNYTYDENGHLTKEHHKDQKKDRSWDYYMVYDEHGSLVRCAKVVGGVSKPFGDETSYTYDSGGRILTETAGDVVTTHEYTLTDGLVTTERVTCDSGDFHWTYYYRYTYDGGAMVLREYLFEKNVLGECTYTQTPYSHYAYAAEWLGGERMP